MVNSYPPLGLGYLAGALRREGHQVKIYDYGLEPKAKVPQIVKQVLADNPDVIGITTWTHLYHVCLDIADQIKQQRKDIVIVLGGPHTTIFPVETLQEDEAVDYCVYGEGEMTIVELMRALEGKISLSAVDGLAYREGGRILKNKAREMEKNLEWLPFPDRKLMNILKYPLRAWNGERMTTMMTSRGCPFACSYCYKGLWGRKYLVSPNDGVLEEIKEVIREYGITHFYFVDDLFVVNVKRLLDFIERLKAEKLNIRWQCLARVDCLKEEHYYAMAEAGCGKIHFGIETADPEIMKVIDKETTPDRVRLAVNWAHEAGIRTKGYFMIGLPGDTEETIQKTIDFAAELPLDEVMFSLTTPFPGTRLWELVKDRFTGIPQRELFQRASYYYGTQTVNEPMFNLSDVPTPKLIEYTNKADKMFSKKSYRRRKMEQKFGKVVGSTLWRLSKSTTLKNLPPLKPLTHLGKKWLDSQLASVR